MPGDATSDPTVWVDRHGDALFRYALLRTRDPDLAEDMVQECLVAALDARERFSAQSSERTWLIGILKRKIIDHIRRVTRERLTEQEIDRAEGPGESLFDQRGCWKSTPPRWGGDPGMLMENREFWDVMRSCLAGLPSGLADTFLLRELDQVSSEEVCKVLKVSPTNLWARLHRARTRLRHCLERNWFSRKG